MLQVYSDIYKCVSKSFDFLYTFIKVDVSISKNSNDMILSSVKTKQIIQMTDDLLIGLKSINNVVVMTYQGYQL